MPERDQVAGAFAGCRRVVEQNIVKSVPSATRSKRTVGIPLCRTSSSMGYEYLRRYLHNSKNHHAAGWASEWPVPLARIEHGQVRPPSFNTEEAPSGNA